MPLIRYDSYENAEECARNACEFLRNDTSDPPKTIAEVIIDVLRIADPYVRRRTDQLIRSWVAPGGPYEDLTRNGKYAVQHKATAQRLGLPYRRSRRLTIVNRIKAIDLQVDDVEQAAYLPAQVKRAETAMLHQLAQNSGKTLSPARTTEMAETFAEARSVVSTEFRSVSERLQHYEERCAFLEDALMAALGSGNARGMALPAPAGADD
jgi:hypothetical protein